MIPAALIDDIEARLDRLADEARLRQRQRATMRRVGSDEVGAALDGIRCALRVWGGRAAVDVPRAPTVERRA